MERAALNPFLSLADVHRVTAPIGGRERDLFVFDHHRSAFALWSLCAQRLGRPLSLLTLDRHMDLGTPRSAPPPHTAPLRELDSWARFSLAPSNDDHIVAALEAGAIAGAAVVARSHQPPELARFQPYRDARGVEHPFSFAPSLERSGPALLHPLQLELPAADAPLVLDIDLDCFTTRSDGHLDEVIPWDAELIDAFLRPPGFDWAALLPRVHAVTIAREPYHCGGLGKGARLWGAFAEVFFEQLLGVPQP